MDEDNEIRIKKNDNEDDDICLSENALKALLEFFSERENRESTIADKNMPSEHWQMSQFWYTDKTCDILAEEAILTSAPDYKVACLSCPSLCLALHEQRKKDLKLQLGQFICFEYDSRFEKVFGNEFQYYDYNDPLNFPNKYSANFDIVIADPPFLSLECLEKFTQTIKYITKGKIILCTGAIMAEAAHNLLDVTISKFQPQHKNKLANEFVCLTNYRPFILNS